MPIPVSNVNNVYNANCLLAAALRISLISRRFIAGSPILLSLHALSVLPDENLGRPQSRHQGAVFLTGLVYERRYAEPLASGTDFCCMEVQQRPVPTFRSLGLPGKWVKAALFAKSGPYRHKPEAGDALIWID